MRKATGFQETDRNKDPETVKSRRGQRSYPIPPTGTSSQNRGVAHCVLSCHLVPRVIPGTPRSQVQSGPRKEPSSCPHPLSSVLHLHNSVISGIRVLLRLAFFHPANARSPPGAGGAPQLADLLCHLGHLGGCQVWVLQTKPLWTSVFVSLE